MVPLREMTIFDYGQVSALWSRTTTTLRREAGPSTGIAAALSMAASEDPATKAAAARYAGTSCVITVIVLILPYLLIDNYYASLACTLLAVVAIVARFNFSSPWPWISLSGGASPQWPSCAAAWPASAFSSASCCASSWALRYDPRQRRFPLCPVLLGSVA